MPDGLGEQLRQKYRWGEGWALGIPGCWRPAEARSGGWGVSHLAFGLRNPADLNRTRRYLFTERYPMASLDYFLRRRLALLTFRIAKRDLKTAAQSTSSVCESERSALVAVLRLWPDHVTFYPVSTVADPLSKAWRLPSVCSLGLRVSSRLAGG